MPFCDYCNRTAWSFSVGCWSQLHAETGHVSLSRPEELKSVRLSLHKAGLEYPTLTTRIRWHLLLPFLVAFVVMGPAES